MTDMIHGSIIFIAAVFALAGFVKGVIGLGLPTISMGLLALVMPPVEAAAVLIVPSLLTNVWQMFSGNSLRAVALRLWPMTAAHYGTAILGIALALYAISGFVAFHFAIPRRLEIVFGPLVGAVTGLITAATGVFVIPAVPYLQAIGLEKDDLVQALGLSFTVSTIALAFNVGAAGALDISVARLTIVAVLFAVAGMWLGQILRLRLSPARFRRWFFAGLLLLGVYLTVGAFA
jgi:hypothetical protein